MAQQSDYPVSTTQLSLTASGTTIGSGNTQAAAFTVLRTMVRTGLSAGELASGSQTWTVRTVVSATSGLFGSRFQLQRRNSAGVVQSSSPYTTAHEPLTVGTYTEDVTWDSGTWNANDQLALVWEGYRTSGTGNKTGTIDANGASYVLAPLPAATLSGASVVAVVAGFVTNSLRRVLGQVSAVTDVGMVTDGAVPAQGVVSWASLETPKPVWQGAVDNPTTFGTVVAAVIKRLASVASPFTLTPVIKATVTARSASATDLTFGTVTNGARTIYGASASEFTFGTVTDGGLENRGLVSWAALEVPVAAAVAGAVDVVLTDGITTNGVRVVYGKVDNPTTFDTVTNGTAAGGGAVSVEETFTIVTASTVGMRSTVSATEAFSAATSGVVTARGAVAVAITADTVTNSLRTVYGTVAAPETIDIVTGSLQTLYAQTALPITFGVTTQTGEENRGIVSWAALEIPVAVAQGAVDLPITANFVSTGSLTIYASASTALGLNVTTGQRVTELAAVATPITFTATTSGIQSAVVSGAASLELTHTTVAAGLTTRYGAVVYPTTLTITSSSMASKTSTASLEIGANVQTNGVRTVYSATTLPIQIGLETRGNKEGNVAARASLDMSAAITTTPWLLAHGRVDQPITFTTTTGTTNQAFGAVSMPLYLNIKSGTPIYQPGTRGRIVFPKRGIARRPNTGRIANPPVRSAA